MARNAIEAAVRHHERDAGRYAVTGRFTGIGRGAVAVSGTAVLAEEIGSLLNGRVLPAKPVPVVPTRESSWAVVFPRFSTVVAESGGELSHAAILLREAGIPCVVDALGSFRASAEGDLVHVDLARGEVVMSSRHLIQRPRMEQG